MPLKTWNKESLTVADYDFCDCREWALPRLELCLTWELERELGSNQPPFRRVDPDQARSIETEFDLHVVSRSADAKPIASVPLQMAERQDLAAFEEEGLKSVHAFLVDWSFDPGEIKEAFN